MTEATADSIAIGIKDLGNLKKLNDKDF